MRDPLRLEPMLEARSIAIVGASDKHGSLGATTIDELLAGGYGGRVFPVNPRLRELSGLRCYPSLREVPEVPDLVILAVGDSRLEEQLMCAAEVGARSAAIFATAYEAPSDDSPPLTERLADIAAKARMAVCGANCMGFVNATRSLRACGYTLPRDLGPGPISFISHSGSTFSTLLHNNRGLRFNVAVSPGQELVTTAADYLRYCVEQEETRAVGLFIEQIRDPTGFSAAMAVAERRDLPVVVLKVGSDPRSRDLVKAHSGALAGDDGAYEAYFDSFGIHRVRTLEELADTLELLAAPRRAARGGLSAVTDSGGERAFLIDLAAGVRFAEPAPATIDLLAELVDPGLPAVNPLDAWGSGVDADRIFKGALRAMHDDDDTGALVFAVDLTGRSWQRYASVAAETASSTTKPFAVLANYPGGMNRAAAAQIRAHGVPVLEGTATGLAALEHLFDHRDFRSRTPLEPPPSASTEVRELWRARLADPSPLGEVEALALVAAWGIPVAGALPAASEDAAVEAALRLGWPVALKTAAPGVAHKSDLAGVALGLEDQDAFASAYRDLARRLGPEVTVQTMSPPGVELALGVVHDPSFGPVVLVGAGGTLVELFGDRRVALAPVDAPRARRLLDGLKMRPLLDGARGQPPVDLDAVVSAVVRLSSLASDLAGHLGALDVNPLVATAAGCIAVDALVEGRPGGRATQP
jgi:acyl-CoA synthetase (NDP forming)